MTLNWHNTEKGKGSGRLEVVYPSMKKLSILELYKVKKEMF